MGAWGAGIFQNDDACDIRDTYREKLILGKSDQQAEEEIIEEFIGTDGQNLWIPLAVTQWKTGRLSEMVKSNAFKAIEHEMESIAIQGADNNIAKRRTVLQQARDLLETDMPPRKKLGWPAWAWKCPWKCGNVLQYRLDLPGETNLISSYYILFRIVGVSKQSPSKVSSDVVALRVYDWIKPQSPLGQLDALIEHPPQLRDFILLDGKTHCQICYESFFPKYIKDHDIQIISETPIDTLYIPDVYVDSQFGSGGKFEPVLRETFQIT